MFRILGVTNNCASYAQRHWAYKRLKIWFIPQKTCNLSIFQGCRNWMKNKNSFSICFSVIYHWVLKAEITQCVHTSLFFFTHVNWDIWMSACSKNIHTVKYLVKISLQELKKTISLMFQKLISSVTECFLVLCEHNVFWLKTREGLFG